ncbi:MAG: hypothetical protein JWO95_1494 [Verrucomicrobiales bacterium]|nr:hypothetical protein [Verrucomicrobiales bacterium]
MSIATDSLGNPILEQFSEDGFIDCVFKISDLAESAGFYNFHVSASSDGAIVGMDVVVRKDIKAGFDAEMNLIKDHVYDEGVIFIRSGIESDRLIARIASLYGMPHSGGEMTSKETFTAIALHQEEIDLSRDVVRMKIFGRDVEPFDEEAYYESFFHIDLANGIVNWNEKDQEYRKPMIGAVTKLISGIGNC